LNFNANKGEKGELELMGADGATIWKQTVNITSGVNTIPIYFPDLAAGIICLVSGPTRENNLQRLIY